MDNYSFYKWALSLLVMGNHNGKISVGSYDFYKPLTKVSRMSRFTNLEHIQEHKVLDGSKLEIGGQDE